MTGGTSDVGGQVASVMKYVKADGHGLVLMMLRVEAERLGVVGDRLQEFLLGVPGIAAIEVGGGLFRDKPDRLVIVGDRLVELVLGGQGILSWLDQEAGAAHRPKFFGS